ncbi:Asp-tRNA(Asn)/Glu-tRNA(Gln) amidotransferase subunit GatC [Caenispirillum bisanense]|uniref:Asp-tRNA(Asn)/Glu-tRNA(Gln) amidotransferase subunit GatC n=1 Tax=Caenispirillum bisanense TaxID=414052 RepID=UPI0031D2D9AB
MSLDNTTVRNIAFLARIEVPDAELPQLAEQLTAILGFVEQLGEVDTQGVEPMTSVTDMALRWRDDVVSDGGIQQKVLANAPDAIEGFFTVPKVVE